MGGNKYKGLAHCGKPPNVHTMELADTYGNPTKMCLYRN